jgi:CheY-like chemotaxis protein
MAILFARSFLRIPEFYPKWNVFYRVLIVLVVVDTIIILQGNFELGLGLYMLASMMYQGGVIASSIYVLKQGFKPARFFLLAWVFLALGGMVYMWTLTGLIESSLLGQYSFLLGTVIEAIFLSWALAELINKNKNDQIENERHYRQILNKTSKRLADALKLAEKHKKVRDIFLKQISHELKTPLNSIDHVLDNAFKGYELTPEHIKDAHHSSRLVSRYIDKLLLNTEMSAATPTFQQDQQDINILLKNWYEDLQLECYQKNIQFEFRSNLSDWHRLHGPVRAVYLLATEIIYNVCEMDLASIELDLHFDESSKEIHIKFNLHSNMKWQVASAEQMFVNPQDAIFVDEVVKLIGGTWQLDMVSPNIEGQISLPGFSTSMKAINEALPQRVLVVEDNKVNQKVMASMLKRMGIEHELANDGEEALKLQAESPCSVILMDCQMPVMDGFDATVAMRRQEQRYQKPIIIAVSANSMEQDKTQCFAVGMDDFIAKPVRMDELRNLLMRWSR